MTQTYNLERRHLTLLNKENAMHPIENYRDDFDALIGPIEQILADLDTLAAKLKGTHVRGVSSVTGDWDTRLNCDASTLTNQTRGALLAAIEALEDVKAEIDDYEEPAPEEEPEEVDSDDEDDDGDDEDEEDDE